MIRRTIDQYILLALAFMAGFVLMVFEMVASRVLAPTIGSSTYIWTSVIGVIIAALSLGYFLGGRLADKREQYTDLAYLFLASALGVAATFTIYGDFLAGLSDSQMDNRLQAVVASLLLFAPTSLVLGMLSPYLAKLNVKSLESSGRSVASLSALNSIGGIVGTFFTGFVLFAAVGSKAILVGLVLALVICSWSVAPKKQYRMRVWISVVVLFLVLVPQAIDPSKRHIDTASAHYVVEDVDSGLNKVRVIATGPGGYQSGIILGDRSQLTFWYTREIANLVSSRQEKSSILNLGGGAFVLPSYLADKYPGSQIDVVEIDPQLVDIAKSEFGYVERPNMRVIAGDARTFVNQTDEHYDIVIVDVYGDGSIPFTFMTAEYGRAVSQLVKPGGIVVANIIAGQSGACRELLNVVAAPYASYFPVAGYVQQSAGVRSNIVAVFGGSRTELPNRYKKLDVDVKAFSDDFAPVEPIQQSCNDMTKSARFGSL